MSFRIALTKLEMTEARLFEELQAALAETYEEESELRKLTQVEMASKLGVDPSLVSKWMRLQGNPTLRTIAKLYYAMDREPLSNIDSPKLKDSYMIKVVSNQYSSHSNQFQNAPLSIDFNNSIGPAHHDRLREKEYA